MIYSAPLEVSSPTRPMPRLFLIDGSSQMYRAYHAIRGLTGPDGKSTNAVYGFVTMLRKLIADHTPEYIAASFDLPGRTFRDDIAADYKANRAPMPGDLAEQVPLVREACEAFGVPVLTSESFEADDVIGTLATAAHTAGFDVAIVTGDKDFFQLVTDGIRVYNPRDEGTWYDAAGVLEKFGVRPDQVVDVLALMGDSIDNIKGVPGIGEKGARELIATHGSLDARPGGCRLDDAQAARGAHQPCRRRAPEPRARADPHGRARRVRAGRRSSTAGPSRQRCFTLFSSLGFRTLVADYAPTAETSSREYAVVTSLDEVDALAKAIRAAGRVGLAVDRHGRVSGARGHRRLGVCDEDRRGALHSPGAHRPRRHAESAAARGVRAAGARAGGCRHQESRPRSEVRDDRPGP